MRGHLPFLLTTTMVLFLVEAHRVLLSVLFSLVYAAVQPELRPGALAAAALPLGALLAPLLPLSRGLDRRHVVAGAAGAAALAHIALSQPAFAPRAGASMLVVASAGIFLVAAVGVLEARAVAAGAAAGLVLDQLLRFAGWSYDAMLQPAWWPVALGTSLAAVGLTAAWLRRLGPGVAHALLERRAGGLRLRGAIAFGTILFFETSALGLPAAGSRWTGVPYAALAVAVVGAGALAVLVLAAADRLVGRHRPAAAVLAGAATAAVLVAWVAEGWGPALLLAGGHGAALLLLGRALAPATGRRSGGTLVVGLLVLTGLHALYALTFFPAFTVPALRGAAPWIFLGAGAVLIAALVLIPRPPPLPPVARSRPAAAWAAALIIGAAALAWRGARAPVTAASPPGQLRVATYNVHYGLDETWRYDPAAIAATIEASAADVVALQEAPVGLPTSYGVDLALWLGRRLGMRAYFAPSVNGLLGGAFLTRLPVVSFGAHPLSSRAPPGARSGFAGRDERGQIGRLVVIAGPDTVAIHGVHFGLTAAERRVQVDAALRLMGARPTVLAGDLNAGPTSAVARALRAAGFRDAFEAADVTPAPTAPARRPRERIDWVWVRGYEVLDARVLDRTASDHRLVVATLRTASAP